MCQVRMSILEVYQEQLKDLLRVSTANGPGGSAKDTNGLRIREQIDGTVWVENLTELVVTEDGDFNRLLSGALKRRVVGAHSMNDVSSRSHFCCILNINQVFHATGVKINSKVHFIDLAGSEMVSGFCMRDHYWCCPVLRSRCVQCRKSALLRVRKFIFPFVSCS